MLLFIPSIVINAVLVTLAIYAMWTRGIDLTPRTVQTTTPALAPVPPAAYPERAAA